MKLVLTPEQRKEIEKIWDNRETVKTLAVKYKVSEGTIKNVIYRLSVRKHNE